MDFDLHSELASLRQQTALIRKQRYARSRLDRHRAELLALHQGALQNSEFKVR